MLLLFLSGIITFVSHTEMFYDIHRLKQISAHEISDKGSFFFLLLLRLERAFMYVLFEELIRYFNNYASSANLVGN